VLSENPVKETSVKSFKTSAPPPPSPPVALIIGFAGSVLSTVTLSPATTESTCPPPPPVALIIGFTGSVLSTVTLVPATTESTCPPASALTIGFTGFGVIYRYISSCNNRINLTSSTSFWFITPSLTISVINKNVIGLRAT